MKGKKLLHSIQLEHLLSYGAKGEQLALEPLNVLVGPNASGKSNLIESLTLLAAAPRDIKKPFWEGGGVREWLWKGTGKAALAKLVVTLDHPGGTDWIDYGLSFKAVQARFQIVTEMIRQTVPEVPPKSGGLIYRYNHGEAVLREWYADGTSLLRSLISFDSEQSVLSQFKSPEVYPEITYLAEKFGQIRFFRDWSFGKGSKGRGPQATDLPNDFLLEDASNLALVLNKLKSRPATKKALLSRLRALYEGVEDFDTTVEGGTVQVFFHEEGLETPVPSTRLSDGTLRYLCLLAILCHPEPPPLICLEEPELGLHPDIIRTVGQLLIEASQRTQLIVTTHSETLISSLTNVPEAIVICERGRDGTSLRRLEKEKLETWLKDYMLGEVWRMGELGGNRW